MAPSPSPPLHAAPSKKSTVRIAVSPFPSKISHRQLVILLLLLLLAILPTSSKDQLSLLYRAHCNSIVPESPLSNLIEDTDGSFTLSNNYFYGGDQLFHLSSTDSPQILSSNRYFQFYPESLYQTTTPGVRHISGPLTLQAELKTVRFDLSGFWSASTGRLCMVGSGLAFSNSATSLIVVKINYPSMSNISTTLVSGKVERWDNSSIYFDPISFLVFAKKGYSYTKLLQVEASCSRYLDSHKPTLESHYGSLCYSLQSYLRERLQLEYGSDCIGTKCGPFNKVISGSVMTLNQIQCSEQGRLRLYISFSNSTDYSLFSALLPERSLVGEGLWDMKKNRLCLLACPILINSAHDSVAGAYVGDCTIGLSLWFSTVLSIKNRSTTFGRIWSNRDQNDPAYFRAVSFHSLERHTGLTGFKYEYTEADTVRKSCPMSSNAPPSSEGRRYPDGKSSDDMSFSAYQRNADMILMVSGYPLSIGEDVYRQHFSMNSTYPRPRPNWGGMNHSLLNISYTIGYRYLNAFSNTSNRTEISAEGIYDSERGSLCMVGCHYNQSSNSWDCGILINIQLAPLNPEAGDHPNGTIRSTRANNDPLYFEPLEFSVNGIYAEQAIESIWRMDVEVTMLLISLTLSCIFIRAQLIHANKHRDALASVSFTMLVVLFLGFMVRLVLNLEAMFIVRRNTKIVLMWSGGWLEVNEVIVRAITMVAFLLQFRFLQVAWSARSASETKKGLLWVAERKALMLCLPLYVAGGFIAWLVHLRLHQTQQEQQSNLVAENHHSVWGVLSAYSGLILSGFLLPQIILNIFWNSKDKALSPIFYIGTTLLRLMPHLYDAYRAHHYFTHLHSSYIFARADGDFFSTAWDIVVPCGGVVFAVIIYLQQRLGGNCILPPRLKSPAAGGYEMVSEVSL